MTKLFAAILLVTFSWFASAAQVVITSPADGHIIRDEIGRINLAGVVQFAEGESTEGYLGKVICGTTEATVSNPGFNWSISSVELASEGANTITCSYTRNGQTSTSSINVSWMKPVGEVIVSSPANGLVLRDEIGKFNVEGRIQFGPGEIPSGNFGRVVCNEKDAAVLAQGYSWKIFNLQLSSEGTHPISCSYTRNGQTSTKTFSVVWTKPTGEVFINSPTNGQVIRDLQGKIDIEGYIQFGAGEEPSGSLGKVTCNDKQGSVKVQDRTWKISSFKLAMEGNNLINCSYTRNGRTSNKSITVLWSKTNIAPVAQFTFTPQTGRAPLEVSFDASSSNDPDGTITVYSWNFSDGTTAQGPNVTRTFTTPGNFGVTLTVIDNESTMSHITKYVFVDVSSTPPIAQLVATPSTGEAPLAVTFDASLSFDPDGGGLKEYRFDFGDGTQTVTTTPFANHVYMTEGNYTARLIAQDTEDELSEEVETVIQVFRANQPPVALIDATPISGYPPLEVNFSAGRSTDSDGTIASYQWFFPNGVTKSGVEVTHVFEQPGTFEIILVVRDDRNVPSEARTTITVDSDTVGPSLSISPGNNAFIRIGTPQFEINYTDAVSGVDLASLKAYMDGDDITARLQVGQTQALLAYTLEFPISSGVHQLTIEAKDLAGNLSTITSIYRVDLGETPTAYISGTVVDIDGQPLAGVLVEDIFTAPKRDISVLTDAEGRYKIAYTQPGTYRLSYNKAGYTESVRTINPAIVEATNMPLVYMGEADPVVTPIMASAGGTATNSTGTLDFEIPAGVLPFDTNVSLTEFTDERVMPGPLPAMSMFTYAFDTRPLGLQLNGAASLSLENTLGFPAGTPIVYGIFDRQLGRWLDSGLTLIVGENKKRAMRLPVEEFQTGDPNQPGTCTSTCTPPLVPPTPTPPCNSECCPGSGGGFGSGGGILGGGDVGPGNGPDGSGTVVACVIDTKTGNLSVDHDLPGLVVGGEDYGLKFAYHSTQTNPQFFVESRLQSEDIVPPLSVAATFTVGSYTYSRTYEGSTYPRNSVFRAIFDAKTADGSYLPTGTYQATYSATTSHDSVYATAAFFGGPPRVSLPTITRIPVRFTAQSAQRTTTINRRLSPFGAGWGLAGLERLHVGSDGTVLWENGGKGNTYYVPIGQSADFSRLEKKSKLAFNPQVDSIHAMNGAFYATDCSNHAVYRISASGQFELVAGTGEEGFAGDGGQATAAQLNCPVAVAPAETGGFYIADSNNYRIRRVAGDGKISTLAHNPAGKPLSVSEDKMRAVYFTTHDSVMLISPRGEMEVYSSERGGYVEEELKRPSQVFFNHDDYPVVVDSNNGRIITAYPEARKFVVNLDGQSKKNKRNFKPKTVSFDPVTRSYYILDQAGELHMWGGVGHEEVHALELTSDLKLGLNKTGKKQSSKIKAMAYSPELGFAFALDGELVLAKNANKMRSSRVAVSYVPSVGIYDQLLKKDDGSFEITQLDGVKKAFDTEGRLIGILRPDSKNSFYMYNELGLLSEMTFPGGSYEFEYDGRGYLSSVTDSAGRETQFVVDDEGRLVTIENPDGSEKNYGYETDGLLLNSETDEDGLQKTFEYERGRIVREVLPGDRVRDFIPEYLKENRYPTSDVPVQGVPTTQDQLFTSLTTKAGDCTVRATFELGVLKSRTDCLGNTMTNTIDSEGRVTDQTSPENRAFRYSYDTSGRTTFTIDRNGRTSYEYDLQWSKPSVIRDDALGTTRMSYNSQGLLEQVIDQDNFTTAMSYDEFGNLTTVTDALNQVTVMEYDEKNNLKATVDPLNHRTEYNRDLAGNVVAIKDPENRVTEFEFDDFNRLVAIFDPMNYVTSMSYTPKGKIESITDARQNTTSFQYHPNYEVVERILNPQGQAEFFTFDGNERVKTKTNKDGSIINFSYDANGRLLLKTATTGSIAYTYDRDGLATEIANDAATLAMEYDEVQRVDRVTSSHVPGAIVYTYNNRGLKSSMTYSIGNTAVMSVSYTYNARKLLSGMTANLNGEVITWERFWDELGRPETDIYSNGMTIERRYDAAGRLTYLSNEMNATAPLARFEYAYNPAGTIAEITKTFTRPGQGSLGRQVLSYGYDALDRLTSASTDGQFVYDELGNQLQRGGSYNSLNQLNDDNEFSYTYSMNGNLTEKVSKITGDKTQYAWDDENRLKQVMVKDSGNTIKRSVSYKYDGSERRIEKTSNGAVTKYLLDQEDIIAEFNADNSIAALYLHGPGIDEPIAMLRDGELYFYAKDHLNSVHTLTDRTGKPVQRYNYSAYGRTKVEKVQASWSFVKNPYAYTSREWEQETGDYYYRARYYDPTTGRFLSLDPIGFEGGDSNFYRYVFNQPILKTDPTGKSGLLGKVGILVGGVILGKLADSCTKQEEPVVKDPREKEKQLCEDAKQRQLEQCGQGWYNKEICESIRNKKCD